MTSLRYITIDDLKTNGTEYLGRGLRVAVNDQADTCVPSFGEQALQSGVTYTYGGSDGRTMIFVNKETDVPMQIYHSELTGMRFTIVPRPRIYIV